MTDFRVSGMSAEPTTYRRRALAFLVGVLVIGTAGAVINRALPTDALMVTMSTSSVAGGIESGSSVVLNGAEIGVVDEVSVYAPDAYEVVLELDPARIGDVPDVLTDDVSVTYAPKNLFGISAVVMTGGSGGTPLRNGSVFQAADPGDATLTTLLHNLSELQNEAFDPYVSDILAIANQATQGLLPLLGAAGQIARDVADTQLVTPAQTLPQYTELVSQLDGTVDDLLPAVQQIMEWEAPQKPGYLEASEKGLSATAGVFVDDLAKLLGPTELGLTAPLMPVLTELIQRVQATFPQARRNGIQIANLIERLRTSLPEKSGKPVLNVDLILKSAPGLAAALRLPDRLPDGTR